MQSLAIAMCTLLGLGVLLFGSDYLDRRLLSRAGDAGPGARRDAAAAVTAALTPVPVASAAPRPTARLAAPPAAVPSAISSAVEAPAAEGHEPSRPSPALAAAAAPAPA